MTGSDGGSMEDSNDSEEPPTPPSEGDAGSRFDAFLDRLDEREAKRSRTAGEGENAQPATENDTPDSASKASIPSERAPEDEADADGWVWGGPRSKVDPDPDGQRSSESDGERKNPVGAKETDTQREETPAEEVDPVSAEKTDPTSRTRVWNADLDEQLDISETADSAHPRSEAESATEPTATRDEEEGVDTSTDGRDPFSMESAATSDHSDRSAEPNPEGAGVSDDTDRDGEDGESEEFLTETAISETVEPDRWEKLGATLKAGNEASEPSDEGAIDRNESVEFPAEHEQVDAARQPVNDPASVNEVSISIDDAGNDLDRVTDSASVLVLGPTGHALSDHLCSKFLVGQEGARNVLFVTFDHSPDDRIDICHRADGWSGGEIGVIEVGRGGRNASVDSEVTSGATGSITVRHVSKPGDLSKLGIVITQLLTQFGDTSRQTVLCFHTLSALHTQVGTKTLFRFLNTLQGRLRSAGAVGHYHMDPDLHDEIVIETIRPIFDSVIRFSADGEFEVE